MTTSDLTRDLLAALEGTFAPAIAKAVLATAQRRTSFPPGPIGPAQLDDLVAELARMLPAYVVNEARRTECQTRLRDLLARAPPAAPREDAVIYLLGSDDITKACEHGREVSFEIGFSELDQVKIATAISELARNVILYAKEGEVHLAVLKRPRPGIEIIVKDKGPGIRDVGPILDGKYRSRTGMGMGLRGTKRLMSELDIQSVVGVGTTIIARKYLL